MKGRDEVRTVKDESAWMKDVISLRYRSLRGAVGRIIQALALLICLLMFVAATHAQDAKDSNSSQTPKKSNARPSEAQASEPFDGATVEKMAGQCVKLETEAGVIMIEMLPEAAPETVRNFLNLTATGAFDTTTFSRVVKDFVVQGGNLSTGQKWNIELAKRAARKIPDEPNYVKHIRGIVSMARPDEPNSATTHFFILVGEAAQLDGKFSAFGRVTSGMDVVDAMNKAPVEDEKPVKPVHLTRAIVEQCEKKGHELRNADFGLRIEGDASSAFQSAFRNLQTAIGTPAIVGDIVFSERNARP